MSYDPRLSHAMAGKYTITLPGSNVTEGTLSLEPRGVFLDAMVSRLDGTKQVGIAAVHLDRLILAWGPPMKVEIGIYENDNLRLTGLWLPPQAHTLDACGREPSTFAGMHKGGQRWKIADATAIDGTTYHGTLDVHPVGSADLTVRPVAMTWTLHDGVYESFGLATADAVYSTFNFEPDTPHGLFVYVRDGVRWTGTEAHDATGATRLERITRV